MEKIHRKADGNVKPSNPAPANWKRSCALDAPPFQGPGNPLLPGGGLHGFNRDGQWGGERESVQFLMVLDSDDNCGLPFQHRRQYVTDRNVCVTGFGWANQEADRAAVFLLRHEFSRIHKGSASSKGRSDGHYSLRAGRKPTSLRRKPGWRMRLYAKRQVLALPFQPPPRNPRSEPEAAQGALHD